MEEISTMLDVLLGRNFAAKCKSFIKLTKSRIQVIRRKRRATEKFLKKDIVDLLFNGLDINAYGRAEGLLVELALSHSYAFVDKSCELALKHLSLMQKLSGCPEECKEAVSSLMFAAARFSDLPELRDLRQIFLERYGNSLECYVNQEFAANLSFKSPTLEKKVCLMQEIASEFSIIWDSKAFKLRMSRSSASAQGQNACMRNHLSDYDKPSHDKKFTQEDVNSDVWLEKSENGYELQNGKENFILNTDDHDHRSKTTVPGKCEVLEGGHDKKSDRIYRKVGSMLNPIVSSQEKTVEQFEGGPKLYACWGNMNPPNENQDTTTDRKSPSHTGLHFRSTVKEPFAIILNRDDHDLQSKSTVPGNGFKPLNCCEVLEIKDGHGNPLSRRQDVISKKSDKVYMKEGSMLKPIVSSQEKTVEQFEGGPKLYACWGNMNPPNENQDTTTDRKSPSHTGLHFRSTVKEPFAIILNRDDHDLQSKSTVPGNGFKPLNCCEVLEIKDGHGNPLSRRQDVISKKSDKVYMKEGSMLKPIGRSSEEKTVEQFDSGSRLHEGWGNTTPPRENLNTTMSPYRIGSRFKSNVKDPSSVNLVGPSDTDKSERNIQNDEMLKPCYSNATPPPYVKQQNSMHGVNVVSSHTDSDGFFTCHSAHEQISLDNSCHEKEFPFCEISKEIPMIKPKSMRRKHSRSRSTHYDAPNVDTDLVRKQRSRSRRRDKSRRGLRNLFNDERYQNAEEERVIDKLLIHYSKKPSILVPEKLSKKSNSHHALLIDTSTRNGSGNGPHDETPKVTPLAPRSISLPREQPGVVEVKKEFARAASFQHVHPKLPDYDDLAARFAALKGR